jgi:outer membrane lipoprotein-sorting protein
MSLSLFLSMTIGFGYLLRKPGKSLCIDRIMQRDLSETRIDLMSAEERKFVSISQPWNPWWLSFSLVLLTWFATIAPSALGAETNSLVTSWLSAQTNIQTWSAEFIQTRTFKSLTQPLTETGQVWFAAPNRFHWELGNPVKTIAVRAPDEMLVMYPRLKRVERYPLTGDQPGPWRDALALLEAGFPRSKAEMEGRLKIVSQTVKDNNCELVLEPKSAAARKMMPQIKITFDTMDFMLHATELQFADGSTMRNDFKNSKLNPKVEDSMFAPQIPADFKIIEPLKQGSPGKNAPGAREPHSR